MSEELKSCPWCYETETLALITAQSWGVAEAFVQCGNCQCCGPRAYEKAPINSDLCAEAARLWNRREEK